MKCIKQKRIYPDGIQAVHVGCGKCLPCLSNKRNDWIFRLTQEYRASSTAQFVTLTYNEKFCPDGLCKSHLQKFFKRLRKHDPKNRIRYFAVGEYGSKYGRPHYHILLFNADDLGDTVRASWKLKGEPIGIVDIRPVNEARIKYITKYILQPELVFKDLPKPFVLMSRRYGIGAAYLTDEMIAWHRADDRTYAYLDEVKTKLPRYYKEKIWYRIKYDQTVQGIVYPKSIVKEHPRRKWVALKSKMDGLRAQVKNMNAFVKKYGVDRAPLKFKEMQTAMISRIKIKVAYTQIF